MLTLLASLLAAQNVNPKIKPDFTEDQLLQMSDTLSHKIEALRQATRCPGVEVVIVKDDKVVFLKAFGYRDLEKRLPMTINTQTMIASCSKAFNATAVMMTADEGKIDLNARPSQYLPYFKLKDPEADAKLTVWDLMNHVSGLPRTDTAGFTYGLTSEEWIRSIGDAEPTFKYRENEQYSNVLVHTSGVIAAQANHMTWPEMVKARIFDPLGMTHSSAESYTTLNEMAVPYDVDPTTGAVLKVPYMEIKDFGVAAGGIKSCAADMAQWLKVQLDEGKLDGHQVIPADVIRREHEPRMASNELVDVASGWFNSRVIPGVPISGHNGALEGFLTDVTLVPSRHLGFAVLTNSHAGGQGAIASMLVDELLGNSGLGEMRAAQFKARGLYVDPAHKDFERISFLGETNALSINRLGEPKIRLNRVDGLGPLKKAPDSYTYVTADPRNRQVRLTMGKEGFDLEENGTKTHYELATKAATGLISTQELQAKVIEAYGGRGALTKPHSFTADFTNEYINEGARSYGHWYHSWPNRFATWEVFTAFGKKLGSSQTIITPRTVRFAATFLQTQKSPSWEGPVVSDATRFCDAVDWKRYEYVHIVGNTTYRNEPVYVVLKHPKFPTHALDVMDYISQNTFHTLRRELGPLDAPEDYSQAWDFLKYETIDGTLIPTEFINIDTGEHRVLTKLTNLKPVPRIPEYIFRIGDFKQKEAVPVEFR